MWSGRPKQLQSTSKLVDISRNHYELRDFNFKWAIFCHNATLPHWMHCAVFDHFKVYTGWQLLVKAKNTSLECVWEKDLQGHSSWKSLFKTNTFEMAQTLWVENEKQFSGGTDVGAKIGKRKLKKKNRKKEERNGMEKKNCYLCQNIFFSQP